MSTHSDSLYKQLFSHPDIVRDPVSARASLTRWLQLTLHDEFDSTNMDLEEERAMRLSDLLVADGMSAGDVARMVDADNSQLSAWIKALANGTSARQLFAES